MYRTKSEKKSWTEAFFRGAKLQIVEVNIQGKMIRAKKYKISQLYFFSYRGDYGTTLSGMVHIKVVVELKAKTTDQ